MPPPQVVPATIISFIPSRPARLLSRLLFRGSPLAVLAAFSWIVWLAYDHGLQRRPVGEPPLVKTPALAIKLTPDESLNRALSLRAARCSTC